jgi:hypothetical protein
LRALVIQNTGGAQPDPAVTAPLREVARQETARVVIAEDGAMSVSAAGNGIGARLLSLLLVVENAQRDGTWAHLKACANGRLPLGVLRPLTQPRRNLVRHGHLREQAQEPGLPRQAPHRRLRRLKPKGATPARPPTPQGR